LGAVKLPSGKASIHFQTINDYGGFVDHDASLTP
jgi:P pilus assembly chaperone PapD